MRTYDYLIPLAINNSSTIEINILWYFILYFCKIAMEHCYVIGKFQVNHHNSPAISHWTDVILGLQKKSASLVPIFRKLLVAWCHPQGPHPHGGNVLLDQLPILDHQMTFFPTTGEKNTHGWIYNSVDKAKAILFLNLSLNMQLA